MTDQLQKKLDELDKEFDVTTALMREGGMGSGHFGHAGRPGHEGGSAPGDGDVGGPGRGDTPGQAKKDYEERRDREEGQKGAINATHIKDNIIGVDYVRQGIPAEVLKANPGMFDAYRGDKDVFTLGRGYFYDIQGDEAFSHDMATEMSKQGWNASFLGGGSHFAPFKGGADGFTKDNSFYYSVWRIRR